MREGVPGQRARGGPAEQRDPEGVVVRRRHAGDAQHEARGRYVVAPAVLDEAEQAQRGVREQAVAHVLERPGEQRRQGILTDLVAPGAARDDRAGQAVERPVQGGADSESQDGRVEPVER
jgi:hypothetical protein